MTVKYYPVIFVKVHFCIDTQFCDIWLVLAFVMASVMSGNSHHCCCHCYQSLSSSYYRVPTHPWKSL